MTTDARERLRERPIGDLIGDFANETTDLLGMEMELARAEIGIQVKRAGAGAGLFGAAAVLGLLGLGALTACAVIALALVIDWWLAALIVGGALVLVAGILALAGRAKVKAVAPPVPERAIGEVKRDIATVQEGVQAGRDSDGDGGGERHGA
jgi:membrane protein